MLIRTKRAQTLELALREHEQDIESDVDKNSPEMPKGILVPEM